MRRILALVTVALLLASSALAACAVTSPPAASSEENAPTPTDTTAAPDFTAREAERALHRAVNRAREERGRAPLAWSDSLRLLARSHSRDMARRSFFGHTSPDGTTPSVRAERLGLPSTRPLGDGRRIGIGENLFRTHRYDDYRDVYRRREGGPQRRVRRIYDWKSKRALAEQTVRNWLDSPPHRRALLSRDYRRHGLGVAFTQKRIYVTQNLF